MTVKTMLLKYQRYLTYLSKLDTLSEPSGSLRVSPFKTVLYFLSIMFKTIWYWIHHPYQFFFEQQEEIQELTDEEDAALMRQIERMCGCYND